MLDWWFDIDNRICCARLDERKTASSIVFEGDVRLLFDDIKVLRSGLTYVYRTPENTCVSVNDVKFRGERYVSLYCDGRLVKEYNVRAERLKQKYYERPEVYDSVPKFVRRMTTACLAAAVFCAPAAAAVMSAFALFGTLSAALSATAALFVLFFLFFAGVASFRYAQLHAQMARYAIISSVKKPKKRARKKTFAGRKRKF